MLLNTYNETRIIPIITGYISIPISEGEDGSFVYFNSVVLAITTHSMIHIRFFASRNTTIDL